MEDFSVNHNLISIFILPGSCVEHVNIPPAVIISAAGRRCFIFKMLMQEDRSIGSTAPGKTVPTARCWFREWQHWVRTRLKMYFVLVKVYLLLQLIYASSN